MSAPPLRIAMWSGPRNISTAMMRSFGNRPDCAVIDEPFYAAYLAATGIDHPMRAETLASQATDPRDVARALLGPVPGDAAIFYQKHMTHHMLPGFDLGWMASCRNAFLIRTPARVLASYARKRGEATLEDIGFVRQAELFEREADRLGHAPPVIDAEDILQDPSTALAALCRALEIPFSAHMLHWPAGRRTTDGPWAPHWYEAVEASTGFAAPSGEPLAPNTDLVEAAMPFYERMQKYRLTLGPVCRSESCVPS
jgi:hypothetical protein